MLCEAVFYYKMYLAGLTDSLISLFGGQLSHVTTRVETGVNLHHHTSSETFQQLPTLSRVWEMPPQLYTPPCVLAAHI